MADDSTSSGTGTQLVALEEFPYQTLNFSRYEIRLLQLHPGEENSPIQGSLTTVQLSENPLYESLSYTWGNPAVTTPITLLASKEPSQSFTFRATTNLAIALKQLRYTDTIRIIWVDAICINQSDPVEKNHQVGIMSEIYASAARVCVSLGEEGQISSEAMSLIASQPQDLNEAIAMLSDPAWGLGWRALTFLVQRRWFSRCWVVQEVALAREVILYCGDAVVPWDSLVLIVHSYIQEFYAFAVGKENPHESARPSRCPAISNWDIPDEHFFFTHKGCRDITALENAKHCVGSVGMKNFLAICSHRGVTDPSDAVYSILGMACGAKDILWDINYEQEAVEVFMDAVEKIVTSTGSLDILCHSQWSEEHEHRHSWVPRFAGGIEGCDCEGYFVNSLTVCEVLVPDGGKTQEIMVDRSVYAASGSQKPDIHFDLPNRRISVRGMVIDKVAKVMDCPVPYRGGITIPKQWKEKAMSFVSPDNIVHHNQNFNTFWRTLVADREQLNIYAEDIDIDSLSNNDEIFSFNNGEYLKQALAHAPDEWATEAKAWMEGDMTVPDTSSSAFLRGAVGYIRSKTFILTEKSMGLGPETCREGDLVCVLMGCSVPVILRPVVGSEGTYNFVGEAYVHGLMDGEAVVMLEDGELEDKRFLIV